MHGPPAVRIATTLGQLTQYSLRAQLITGLGSVKAFSRNTSFPCFLFNYLSSLFAVWPSCMHLEAEKGASTKAFEECHFHEV